MIDPIFRAEGEFIDYFILPERKSVQFISIKTKEEFDKLLVRYEAKKLSVEWEELKTSDDTGYVFSLARISLTTIYLLSNGLIAINQLVNDKANPYYFCENLAAFKLIRKYLLVFRSELTWPIEVQCSIFEHLPIKAFLEREKDHLVIMKEYSTPRHLTLVDENGKCVHISRTEKGDYYWSLVIYESIEKLKLHNVDLQT